MRAHAPVVTPDKHTLPTIEIQGAKGRQDSLTGWFAVPLPSDDGRAASKQLTANVAVAIGLQLIGYLTTDV
jgi:uncharacterized alpha/beta hydrolase family protein